VGEILEKALDKPAGQQHKGDAMRIAGLLQKIGMVKRQRRLNGRKGIFWEWP